MAYRVEVTDTFGGQANWCWIHRHVIDLDDTASKRQIVRAAKRIEGWTSLKCDVEYYADDITLRPRDLCQVMFITWIDKNDDEYNIIKDLKEKNS